MKRQFLEIACFNLASAITAVRAGADRIELCADRRSGGISPARDIVAAVRAIADIPLHVMVRPRPGDFVYTPGEISSMLAQVNVLKQEGADGVVFGVLTPGGVVDEPAVTMLAASAYPMKAIFHRAIDSCTFFPGAIASVVRCGIHGILTSGGAPDAAIGADTLSRLQDEWGDSVEIIAGGGIRSGNAADLLSRRLHIHSSAITSQGDFADAEEISALHLLVMEANKKKAR